MWNTFKMIAVCEDNFIYTLKLVSYYFPIRERSIGLP